VHLKQRRMLTFICSKCILRQLLSPQFCKCQTKFENTKGVSRSRKSKDRPYTGQKKQDKGTNNDLQNITWKTKDRATRTLLKPWMNWGAPEG
jgi:hypothetical protein